MSDVPRRRVPRFVIVVAVLLVAVLAGTILFVSWLRAAARHECELRVESRDDTRAMWVWVAEQNPDAELIDEFRTELNRRLPQLRCEGARLTPVEADVG